jgi:hypothetical protein
VWTWRPGEPPAKIADVAPAVVAALNGDTIDVDPLPIEHGRLTRRRLDRGWTIDLGGRSVADRALAAPGQRWSEHRAGGWMATGFPHADVVHLHGAGAECMVVWPAPRAAIWVGRSLVANTTSGDVVVFEELTDVLERARP